MTTSKAKRKPPHRTYELHLDGELAGYSVVMGAMTGGDLIRLRRPKDDAEIVDLVVERVEQHNFDIPDLRDLDFWIIGAILSAWATAVGESALPSQIATS